MNIRGTTVCVDYADLLARSLKLWHTGLDRLIVITSTADTATQKLCRKHNVETHVTDIFYANGAHFNKGAALSECAAASGIRDSADWILTFDADIVPPDDWRAAVERSMPVPSMLYGTRRFWQPETAEHLVVDQTKKMPQSWVLGFFMLFHANDPHLPAGSLFDLHWPHAGNFDTIFCRRWPKQNQVILPIKMIHLGDERKNWCGRAASKRPTLTNILAERHGHEDWQREKMANPPQLEGLG